MDRITLTELDQVFISWFIGFAGVLLYVSVIVLFYGVVLHIGITCPGGALVCKG
jgi:hypothetical protein